MNMSKTEDRREIDAIVSRQRPSADFVNPAIITVTAIVLGFAIAAVIGFFRAYVG